MRFSLNFPHLASGEGLFVLLYLQLILGASVRHTASGAAVVLHIVTAFFIVLLVVRVLVAVLQAEFNGTFLKFTGVGLGILTSVQFFLGMGSLVFTRFLERGYAPSAAEVWFTAAHQTVGASMLALTLLLALEAGR